MLWLLLGGMVLLSFWVAWVCLATAQKPLIVHLVLPFCSDFLSEGFLLAAEQCFMRTRRLRLGTIWLLLSGTGPPISEREALRPPPGVKLAFLPLALTRLSLQPPGQVCWFLTHNEEEGGFAVLSLLCRLLAAGGPLSCRSLVPENWPSVWDNTLSF